LRAQRAASNARITALEADISADLSPEQRAAAFAQLEAIRAQANAIYDAALRQAGCP